MDHVSKETRSKNMAAVRSTGNLSTEVALGKLLWSAGLRGYRKHWPVAGKPDFAWPGRRVAVFVDGCFWHGCSCKTIPKSHSRLWREKIQRNRDRDRSVVRQLQAKGWTVIRVRECAVKRRKTLLDIRRLLASRKRAIAGS
jgi:DNA mismatch endonuclease (patch repair protein)